MEIDNSLITLAQSSDHTLLDLSDVTEDEKKILLAGSLINSYKQ